MMTGMEWGEQRGTHVARAEDRHACHVHLSVPTTVSPYHSMTLVCGLTEGPVWGTIPAGNRTSFLYRDRLPIRDWRMAGLALPVLSEDETHDGTGTRGGRSHRSDRAPVR